MQNAYIHKRSATKLSFYSMINDHFGKQHYQMQDTTTIVSDRKNVTRPFVRQNQLSTSAEK